VAKSTIVSRLKYCAYAGHESYNLSKKKKAEMYEIEYRVER
jgi:hypothetical protein